MIDQVVTNLLTNAYRYGGTTISVTTTASAGGEVVIADNGAFVIAPLVNSILAQEGGKDHGDYVLLHSVGAGIRHRREYPRPRRYR